MVRSGADMVTSQGVYALVTFFGIFLGIVFFFIDGMLLWSIGFFSLAVILVLLKVMWVLQDGQTTLHKN